MKRRNCYRALAGSTAKFLFHLTLAAIPLEFSQQLISRFGSPSEARGEKERNVIFGTCLFDKTTSDVGSGENENGCLAA
jgi:hypothetical protein